MNRPNPSRARAALYGAATLILTLTFYTAAHAQSGRKAQKPLGLPTEQAKPADPAAKPAEKKKVEAAVTFVVIKEDVASVGIDMMARDGVASAFVERLRQAAGSVDIKEVAKGNRQQARERAKKEETAYVVFFQLDETGYNGTSADGSGLVLRTYVYTPKTGDLKYTDTMFQRPYQDSARIGGVRVPVPTRRIERYPSQRQLERAARDAADRLLSRFNVTPPPEQ